GQPLAAIIRDALIDALARQPATPASPTDLAETVAAMAARLETLAAQVQTLTDRLDRLAASRQPGAAMADTARQPAAADVPSVAATRQPAAASTPGSAATRQPRGSHRQQHRGPAPRHGLPQATLEAIAEERTHCEGLSLREFAQRL